MKIDAKIIEWNKTPFNMDDKISKEVRNALCKRFEVAIANLRDDNILDNLLLKNGWVILAKDNISFVLNPIKDENLPDNPSFRNETLGSSKLGAKLRIVRDDAWECEKYSDLAKIAGLTLDQTTGKITYKLI